MDNKERAHWKKYDSSAAGTKVSATRKKHCMSVKGRAVGYKLDDKGDDKEESIAGNSAIPGHKLYLRREKEQATPAQLFNIKKENIRVDEVYCTCSQTTQMH
jgi:hypothetical protein